MRQYYKNHNKYILQKFTDIPFDSPFEQKNNVANIIGFLIFFFIYMINSFPTQKAAQAVHDIGTGKEKWGKIYKLDHWDMQSLCAFGNIEKS